MRSELGRIVNDLDRGFYREVELARKRDPGVSSFGALNKMAREKGVYPTEPEQAARRTHFLKWFRVPLENGKAEAIQRLADETWALEQALSEREIYTRGRQASTLDKFFTDSGSAVLFPAYVETQAIVGMLEHSLVPSLVSQEQVVDSHLVQHVRLTEGADDRKTALGSEGARSPLLRLKTADATVKLQKYQAELQASYEALRLQRLNVVSVFLRRVGAQLGIDETDDLLEVAISGDGNSGSPVSDTDAEVGGVLDYHEVVRLSLAFPKGYRMRAAVVNSALLQTLLTLDEFKDPMAGFQYQATGMVPNFIGCEWYRWSSTGSSAFSTDRILALDTAQALVQYTEQGMMIEADRLIDRQFERTVISKWTGFGKLDYNATQCFDLS
jgi:hypothetical protein